MSVFRFPAKLPVGAVQTYAIARPEGTHTRPATCAEVHCPAHEHGWSTRVPAGSVQEDYIRRGSGRKFSAEANADGTVTFTFEPGQRCFASDKHRVSLERPATFARFGGDWRGRTSDVVILRPDDWANDFAEHQQRLSDAQN